MTKEQMLEKEIRLLKQQIQIVVNYCNNIIIALHNNTVEFPAPFLNYYDNTNASIWSGDGTSFGILEGVSWMFRTNITDGTYTYNIYRDGNQICSDITQTSFTDTNLIPGTYEYTVSTNYYGGVSNLSEPTFVTIVDPYVSLPEVNNIVSVYPNPTNGKVYIKCEDIKNVKIVSITGQIVGYIDVNDDNATIDMHQYPQSTYILIISKQDGSTVRERITYSR